MSKDVFSIVPTGTQQSAKNLLTDALERDFNTVIIFGFKNGRVYIDSSESEDNLRVLGALEHAKQMISSDWDNAV